MRGRASVPTDGREAKGLITWVEIGLIRKRSLVA
jgi:hypothetical protein